MKALLDYSSLAGNSKEAPLTWPTDSKISKSDNFANLLIFVHPKCPCTRASISELEKIFSYSKSKLKVTVVFSKPTGAEENWEQDFLWSQVKGNGDFHIYLDHGNTEAKLFGVNTSGEVVLYNEKRGLIFKGGITASRGHEGDNLGQLSIISYLKSGNIPVKRTETFGCQIYSDIEENCICNALENKDGSE